MEAFTITRDDTNALLKFNFELPISETALQIDCNFLEGTASSLPARHVREAPRASFPSSRQLRGDGSEPVSASQEVPKIPASPSFRRVGAYPARTRREGRGESSIILVSREEPHLVSHAEVSLSLLALHPTSASCARAGGAEEPGGQSPGRAARRSHPPRLPSPHPNKAPLQVQDTLPARRSRPLGHRIPRRRALCGSRSPGRTKWPPPAG